MCFMATRRVRVFRRFSWVFLSCLLYECVVWCLNDSSDLIVWFQRWIFCDLSRFQVCLIWNVYFKFYFEDNDFYNCCCEKQPQFSYVRYHLNINVHRSNKCDKNCVHNHTFLLTMNFWWQKSCGQHNNNVGGFSSVFTNFSIVVFV